MSHTLTKGQKVKLSKHFNSTEFECKCNHDDCTTFKLDPKLVQALECIRDHFGSPVHITSAYRCKKHNAAVGGAPKSQHLEGIAADIVVAGVDPYDVYDFVDKLIDKSGGVGRYDTFTHIDVRGWYARWP